MPTVTFLSNGHGEDVIGALLAEEIMRRRPDLRVQAFPTVDEGRAYEKLSIPILGPRRAMPSGGLLMHRPDLFAQDLKAGFLRMTAKQLLELRQLETDVLVVVGDIYALLLSSLVTTKARFVVQTLVSAHHGEGRFLARLKHPNRLLMERIASPERALMRRLARHVYVRDEATVGFLRSKGLERVSSLGNPALDAVAGEPLREHMGAPLRVALLPGTRRYAPAALNAMLRALARVPDATGLVAWAGGTLPPPPAPWSSAPSPPNAVGLRSTLVHGEQKVYIYENRFADILHTSQLVLGTAGTANEQAAALGKPVVSFPVPPLYSQAFLRNQKRLLGDALTLAEARPEAVAAALKVLLTDDAKRERAAAAGKARLGEPGGTRAIVADILARAQL